MLKTPTAINYNESKSNFANFVWWIDQQSQHGLYEYQSIVEACMVCSAQETFHPGGGAYLSITVFGYVLK